MPLYLDPAPPSNTHRYEGASLMREGPFAGSLFVSPRPFYCFAFPQAVMRIDDPRSPMPTVEITDIPFYSLDIVSRGSALAMTDFDCWGTLDFNAFDVVRRAPDQGSRARGADG